MANEDLKIQNVERVLQTAYELFLVHGIENTTKEMLAKTSGLSRKSLDRYFINKTDCVLQVADWIGTHIRQNVNRYPETIFTDGRHTGAMLLELYMNRAKELFAETPRIFVCRNEFKNYIYRNCDNFEKGYARLVDALGCHKLMWKIFTLGSRDGSLKSSLDPVAESKHFCEEFLGFLSNVAMSSNSKSTDVLDSIDLHIQRIMSMYI